MKRRKRRKDMPVEAVCAHSMRMAGDVTWTTRIGETKLFCPEYREGIEISNCADCEYRKPVTYI